MRLAGALLGALLIVAGIAAQIVAARHRPEYVTGGFSFGRWTGWSSTAYDLVRIGGWALLVFGAVIVAFALIREFRRPI
jgi:hypothetical protein